MIDIFHRARVGVYVAVLLVLTGCVTGPELPKPTVSQLNAKSTYFVNSIELDAVKEVESKTILEHVKKSLGSINVVESATGLPLNMKITITKLNDVGGFESFMVGGSNSIDANVSLYAPGQENKAFEIDLHAKSSNYAPGGIIGLLAESSSDDEPKLATAIVKMIQQWVLTEQRLSVKRAAVL